MSDFTKAVAKTLKYEGGYYYAPKTGEVANRGITVWFLRSIGKLPAKPRATPASPEEIAFVKALTEEATIDLYFEHFWEPNRLDEVEDQSVAEKIFDLQVNTGQGVKFAQKALNRINSGAVVVLSEDNRMGPRTLLAINRADPAVLLKELRATAEAHYRRLAERPEHAANLKGWLRRLDA